MLTSYAIVIIDRFIQANWQLGDTDGSGAIDKMEFLRLYSKLFLENNNPTGAGGKPPGRK